ncbi:hypothetical protein [Streptomyces sp. NBC_01794]|uniref:hypothetical protein n=1 Tax=Streptomyces sp. NBC_01794 TaxID=2975942 RepID=UPI003090C65E|nr:DUF402 domain-containing protein [Streptomyces sp. NBC_01794]
MERAGLRVVDDTDTALVTACAPGAETRWPSLYAKARTDGDRSVRTEAFEAMARGSGARPGAVAGHRTAAVEAAGGVVQHQRLLHRPRAAELVRDFEHPTRRAEGRFDTFDLAVDLVIDPDPARWQWKDEDEYAHVLWP